MATNHSNEGFAERILQQLLLLRAHDAVRFTESTEPRGLFRYRFRAGGWPIDVIVDRTVLELRVYHGRDIVATGSIAPHVLQVLVGEVPAPRSLAAGASADESRAALRAIVGDWRRKNARIFVEAPSVARHPDGWNNA